MNNKKIDFRKFIVKNNHRINSFILVPRQKHFKNNIKIAKFKKDKKIYKKVIYYYKITFKNNIFIIKELKDFRELKAINQYINKMELYAKLILYRSGSKKILLDKNSR